MSRLTKLDQKLIAEAYSTQLLEESVPHMSISDIQEKLPYMSSQEAMLVEGFFKNAAQALGRVASGVGGVGGAAAKGIQSAGQAVANKAQQAGQAVVNKASQVASNTKNLYNTAATSKEAQQSVENAFQAATQLIDLVQKAQQSGLVKAQGAVTDMTLADIMDELETAKQSADTFKQDAQSTGFTGGVGSAQTA